MKAFHHARPGVVELGELPTPVAGPGEVLLRVAACGLCQTDVHLAQAGGAQLEVGRVLGHEIAGHVVAVGPGVDLAGYRGLHVVHPVWSCGSCRQCSAGRENACRGTDARLVAAPGPGIRRDGGLAEWVVVPVRSLVPAAGLDPVQAALLPDAGLVAWHCIKSAIDHLLEGSSSLVIGLGGLGQYAVTLLAALTATRVIGVDPKESARVAARGKAHVLLDAHDPQLVEQVLAEAGMHGVDLVLDFVGTDQTLALASATAAPYSVIQVAGQGGGSLRFETDRTTTSVPRGATMARPYSGTKAELVELVDLVVAHELTIDVATHRLDSVEEAFADLAAGRVTGRAVIVP